MKDCEGCYGGSTWHKIWNLIHYRRVYEHSYCVAKSASNSSLWHNRLGHKSVKGMKMLTAKEVLEGMKSVDMSPCENCVMSKQKRVSFTRTVRELKKGSETIKQVGVEVELQNNSLGDVVADTQETSETVAEEPEAEEVAPEQVLRRSSRTFRVQDKYSPSLHYLLLIDEDEREPFNEILQLEDTSKWEQSRDDGMFKLHKCFTLSSTDVEYVAIAEVGKEMIWMTDYLEELSKK